MAKRKNNQYFDFGTIKTKPKNQNLKYKFVKSKPAYRRKRPIFAFNYYLCDSKKCSFKTIQNTRSFYVLFKKLKGLSSLTWQEIIENKSYHAHDVNWNEEELPSDIKKLKYNKEIKDLPLFQFKAFDIEEARILGLFNLDNIFEVIGLDRKHKTYSKNK
ncbi:MAG TPA: hypothetical protein DCK79_08105 [Candidatus Atribacteria bacterium]|nr:hypothetical protein [Candidatus Atribacteria bacterium]